MAIKIHSSKEAAAAAAAAAGCCNSNSNSKSTKKTFIIFGATTLIVIILSIFVFAKETTMVTHIMKIINTKEEEGTTTTMNSGLVVQQKHQDQQETPYHYIGSMIEDYVIEHSKELGYNNNKKLGIGCDIWKNPNITNTQIYSALEQFRIEMQEYQEHVMDFQTDVHDLRLHLHENYNYRYENEQQQQQQQQQQQYKSICDTLNVDTQQEGIQNIFKTSGILSKGAGTGGAGYMEPLVPPMRDPEFCFNSKKLLSLDYLVHDFAALCRKLKPSSKIIFIDMGAALDFHTHSHKTTKTLSLTPAIYIIKIFQKFGFHFDHIYGFEIDPKVPQNVYDAIPMDLMASYHWMNIGVSNDPGDKYNPFQSILLEGDYYNQDDFIIVKLDIDTPEIEIPLAHQIVDDDRISKLIDVFYFEHHVKLEELKRDWKQSVRGGTISSSLDLFRKLREKGIAAHFWV